MVKSDSKLEINPLDEMTAIFPGWLDGGCPIAGMVPGLLEGASQLCN